MDDNMDAMMADGLLRTVRDAAKLLYGENQTYPCDDVKRMMDDVGRLRAALIAAVDVFYEMANLLNDEDFAGEIPGLSEKVIGHRERYHTYMVEELSKAGDAARAALEGRT